jgi:hypothetical protein
MTRSRRRVDVLLSSDELDPLATPTELQQRYYGFMLGFMAHFLVLDIVEPAYRSHKRRMQEVMDEWGIPWKLPAAHAGYRRDRKIQLNLATELRLVGRSAGNFFSFGHSAFLYMIDPESRRGQEAFRLLREVADIYELDGKSIERILRPGWAQDLKDARLVTEIMTIAYALVAEAVASVPKEERTCFVIMPFKEPFLGYYSVFYRKALNLAGYAAIRAWQGLSSEPYLNFIFMLMQKCGAALADLSASKGTRSPNLNVVHEVGLNMGSMNTTYLLRRRGRLVLPNNLAGIAHVTYDPATKGWPDDHARLLARALSVIENARQGGRNAGTGARSAKESFA